MDYVPTTGPTPGSRDVVDIAHPEKRLTPGGFVHVVEPGNEYIGVVVHAEGNGRWLVNGLMFDTSRSHHQDQLTACSLAEAGALLQLPVQEGFSSP